MEKETKLMNGLSSLYAGVFGPILFPMIILFTLLSLVYTNAHFNSEYFTSPASLNLVEIANKEIVFPTWKIILGTLLMTVIMYCSYRLFLYERRTETTKRIHAERVEMYTSDRLNTLSKIKFHDIRNNYNRISNLVAARKFDELKTYVDESAYYFGILLNNWERQNWTLHEEFELLNAYLSAEKVLGLDATIRLIHPSILPENTRFIPDVFTTFFQNSIRTKRREEQLIFQIKVELVEHRRGSYLSISVLDNAIPSQQKDYFNESKSNSGLTLLRRRLSSEFKIRKADKERFHFEELRATPLDTGTLLTFMFPYETA